MNINKIIKIDNKLEIIKNHPKSKNKSRLIIELMSERYHLDPLNTFKYSLLNDMDLCDLALKRCIIDNINEYDRDIILEIIDLK